MILGDKPLISKVVLSHSQRSKQDCEGVEGGRQCWIAGGGEGGANLYWLATSWCRGVGGGSGGSGGGGREGGGYGELIHASEQPRIKNHELASKKHSFWFMHP
jgi:hypothetical protein